ncbi:flagellar assembly protein FliX [Falsiroseomonas tokyonensis]|uniref:Flagellar assembly protein FliX n=1 Tax=Falsiroseomonas tokyonensis TaxID=430521 RepID=A0ABV7BUI6_9PROT|nr:flagellar assembly protein FliX [Falsiroseomonas tokyonensis]MBU8537652.1 hypothetical protein [Falsiroseomonas tokyonensis]
MTVGPVRPTGFSGVQAGRARRAGAAFALPGTPEETAAPPAASAPADLTGLLALQESGTPAPPEAPAERGRKRANRALEELRGLQLDLLRGSAGDAARLERLERLAAPPEPGVEPALAALLAEVRLRARLELARRTVARPSSN